MSRAPAPRPACPICGRAVPETAGPRTRPFCSPRCAEVDLGRWFTGGYAIPAAETETGESAEAEDRA